MEEQKNNASILNTEIKLVNDKIHFIGMAKTNEPISIDYTSPIGDDLGYTSLELFLLSLSSCVGSSLALLLRKMNHTTIGLEIKAQGVRREQHPTCFEKVTLEIVLTSNDITSQAVDKALALSEATICPVWAMVKNNVEVVTNYTIVKAKETVDIN
jgi:putative redox protein